MNSSILQLSKNITDLVNNPKFVVEDQLTTFFPSKNKALIPSGLKEMYNHASQVTLRWSHTDFTGSGIVRGDINILPIEKVMGDWYNIVWFDYHNETDKIRQFKIVDYFVNEAVVGFFNIKGEDSELYFLSFGDEPVNLSIDIKGYLELLSMSRGYLYWQKSLVFLNHGTKTVEHEDFVKNTPLLFPEFNFKEFEETYNDLKLK